MENSYEFRKRLLEVHKPNRRDSSIQPRDDEIMVGDNWTILISEKAGRVIVNAAKDLQDYFFTSMGVSVRVKKVFNIGSEDLESCRKLIVSTKEELSDTGSELDIPRSYRAISSENNIIICGFDERGAAQGCYYLEDLMNLKSAPILQQFDIIRKPAFSPRMVHSGYGLDFYPDAHLNAISHAGMDAILVFTKGVNTTPSGYLDFNELIYRAEGYGLDVYAYSYIQSLKHPDDTDSEDYYESTYGSLFKECAGLKGVVLVGESVEFPSRDPRTSGKFYYENTVDGLAETKPSPGWWPCKDFPEWLNMIKRVVRKHNSEADIVFWTYNWGYVEKEYRLELLRNLPTDISLQVTFEMFESVRIENITSACVDYTLFFEGPGQYFISEAEVAHERGIRLYTMCNTAGLTWDIGVIPYEPCPYQWIKRHNALLLAKDKWGLSGLMESHHFGWWPSFISEIAKWAYWSPSPSSDEICRMIASRDFGEANQEEVIEAWQAWSEGIRYYISTNEDQYGPFRIGPSYPLVFKKDVDLPTVPYAHFGGNKICLTDYGNADKFSNSLADFYNKSLLQQRLPGEIKSLEKMNECFLRGIRRMESVYESLPESGQKEAFYMINMAKFITNCVRTVINVKRWYIQKCKLLAETDSGKISEIIDKMIEIGKEEIVNAEEAIPLVEADSRLGWEPSMEYMTDSKHIKWKISQVKYVIEKELPAYKSALKFTY